jgi:hypothetical protein
MSSTDQYFAVKPSLELAKEIMSRVASFQNIVGTNSEGMSSVWNRNLNYYYSSIFYGTGGASGLEFSGSQGELVKMLVPQARALNQQFLSITTKTKLNFEPQAESGDSLTVSNTRIAKALCDQTARKEKLDLSSYRMAEQSSVLGAAYLKPGWNLMRGKKIAVSPKNGAIIRTGDSDIENLSVYDVMFDLAVEDFYKLNDCIVRVVRNRWDLIAQNPQLEERLKTIPSINKGTDFNFFWQESFSHDLIYVYEWYHKSTPALPDGRMMALCDDQTILFDDENPYKNDQQDAYIPVAQMKPEGIAGTGFGYPFFSNILPMQEMMDMCFSAAATNNAATAVQTILNPIGNGINVVDIGGMKFVNYKPMTEAGGGKPETLQMTKTAPETYKFCDMLRSYMMEVYNISGAMRGTPPPGVVSGTAIATLTTNSLEFSQNFSKSYIDAIETCMTYNMWNYKTFATAPMIVSIAGPNNTAIAKQFTNKDISPIRRVTCRMANPLMATSAGKFEIANQLLQQGMIKDPETYWRILEGAPIETLYDAQYSQQELIERENDMMRTNGNPQVLITDNHAKHVVAHLGLIDDPEIRDNGQMTGIVLQHVLEHVNKAREQAADPILSSIVQTGKLPPPQMMMPMGGPPPPPGGMPPPPGPEPEKHVLPPQAEPKTARPSGPAKTLVPQVASNAPTAGA